MDKIRWKGMPRQLREKVQRWRLFRGGGNGGCRRRIRGKIELRRLREERQRRRRGRRDCRRFRLDDGISLLLGNLEAGCIVKEGGSGRKLRKEGRKLKKKFKEKRKLRKDEEGEEVKEGRKEGRRSRSSRKPIK